MTSDSTFADVRSETTSKKPWARRIGTLLLLLFVVFGASGVLGPRTGSTTASQDGVTVSVLHAKVARPGFDVPMTVTIEKAGGFDSSVDVAISSEYLGMFESQRFAPEPSDETREGGFLQFSFDPPDGDVFTFEFDAYVEPGWQRGKSGTVALIDDDGAFVAPVTFRTKLIP